MPMQDDERKLLAREIVDATLQRIYQEIGKSLFRKLLWIGIALLVAAAVTTGMIKLPG